ILYGMVSGLAVLFVVWRAALALIPVGALAGGVIYLVWGHLGDDDELLKALIAGIVVAGGWVAGFVTQELRRADGRDERCDDLMAALEVEIGFVVKKSRAANWAKEQERLAEEFRRDSDYVPYIHLRLPTEALDRIMANVEILPKSHIESVSAYSHLIY